MGKAGGVQGFEHYNTFIQSAEKPQALKWADKQIPAQILKITSCTAGHKAYVQLSRKYRNILLKCIGYVKEYINQTANEQQPNDSGFLYTKFTLGYVGLRKNMNIFL